MKDPEFIQLKNRFLFGLLIALLMGSILIFVAYKSFTGTNSKVYNYINKNNKSIILVIDNKCKNCDEIKNVLDNNKYKYYLYNRSKDYSNNIESILNIDNLGIEIPSLIYLENKRVSSFISNVSDSEEIKDFFNTYGDD